jgi:hypothetical protein
VDSVIAGVEASHPMIVSVLDPVRAEIFFRRLLNLPGKESNFLSSRKHLGRPLPSENGIFVLESKQGWTFSSGNRNC